MKNNYAKTKTGNVKKLKYMNRGQLREHIRELKRELKMLMEEKTALIGFRNKAHKAERELRRIYEISSGYVNPSKLQDDREQVLEGNPDVIHGIPASYFASLRKKGKL